MSERPIWMGTDRITYLNVFLKAFHTRSSSKDFLKFSKPINLISRIKISMFVRLMTKELISGTTTNKKMISMAGAINRYAAWPGLFQYALTLENFDSFIFHLAYAIWEYTLKLYIPISFLLSLIYFLPEILQPFPDIFPKLPSHPHRSEFPLPLASYSRP